MNVNDIYILVRDKFQIEFDINNLEQSLFIFSGNDYFHPTKRIAFPLVVIGSFGIGANAAVLEVQDSKEETFALRISKTNDIEQINIQISLAKFAMAPELFYSGMTKKPGISFSIMERISETLSTYFERKPGELNNIMLAMKCLLDKKFLLGFMHGDAHPTNIAILSDGTTLGFIDFDWSFFISDPRFAFLNILDFIPLIGSFLKRGQRSFTLRLINYYEGMFNIKIIQDRFSFPPNEGIRYGDLFSYIKNFRNENKLDMIATMMMKEFPKLTLPEITE